MVRGLEYGGPEVQNKPELQKIKQFTKHNILKSNFFIYIYIYYSFNRIQNIIEYRIIILSSLSIAI